MAPQLPTGLPSRLTAGLPVALEAKHHDSVSGASKNEGIFGDIFGNIFGSVFGRTVVIQLSGAAKQQFGDEINVVELAKKVVDFWEQQLT